MEVISLQSGSSGNCIYVESNGIRLLFDAGISGRQTEQRLAEHGKDIREVDALIISHDHRDHTACMGVLHRKYGIPLHVSRLTLKATKRGMNVGVLNEVNHFRSGDTLTFGEVKVETIPTPHDAADGVAFVVDDANKRFGVLTDLGHVFADVRKAIASLDAVLLESNYDEEMLDEGPYPEFLKSRISGPHGHISNQDAAELLRDCATERLQWACLAHLSDENNDPAVAIQTHLEILGDRIQIECADRRATSKLLHIADVKEESELQEVTQTRDDHVAPTRHRSKPVQQAFAW